MLAHLKNARKQTHSNIQFYIGIHVTRFDFGHICSDGPFQRALLYKLSRVRWQMRDSENWATDGVSSVAIGPWLLSIAQS